MHCDTSLQFDDNLDNSESEEDEYVSEEEEEDGDEDEDDEFIDANTIVSILLGSESIITNARSMMQWSPHEVADFVRDIPSCAMYAEIFESNSINGEAMLLLTMNDCSLPPLSMQQSSASQLLDTINHLSRCRPIFIN